ncbi:NAD-dependent epimerase/dehydratase family protein [Actinomadura sp. NPDC049753]|uniref:NAD-dependent epimerase/dehydratase family protein n=1 Tax=Actinomadura sp. NPDC049753 TaxID=3154739 RepID=UPI00343EB8C6
MGKHVVVGAGQVGRGLAGLLAEQGHEVVVVSRSGSGPDSAPTVAADATDQNRLIEITKGADALHNCAAPPYHRWPQEWPPLFAALLATAEATGAVLVTAGNLYGYGPVDRPMTEDLPLAATLAKGRVRAKMWTDALAAHQAGRARVTEVRSSDYFGPGAGDQTPVGSRFVPPLLAGKRAMFPTDPTIPHSWTYLPDVVRAMALAATDERAWGHAWHVPTNAAMSPQELAERLCKLAGAPAPRVSQMPRWAMSAIGAVSPVVRELKKTRYQFDRPFLVDSAAFETTFGIGPTPMDDALRGTIAWERRA